MRSLTSFTPYFAEDVTYALEELHGELNDNVDLLHLLQSIFPDECANATAPHTPCATPLSYTPFLARACICLCTPLCTPSPLYAPALPTCTCKLTHPHAPTHTLAPP